MVSPGKVATPATAVAVSAPLTCTVDAPPSDSVTTPPNVVAGFPAESTAATTSAGVTGVPATVLLGCCTKINDAAGSGVFVVGAHAASAASDRAVVMQASARRPIGIGDMRRRDIIGCSMELKGCIEGLRSDCLAERLPDG
jgi:hypothetical protein